MIPEGFGTLRDRINSETERGDPEDKDEETHESDRVGRLCEDPEHRRKPNEDDADQSEPREEEARRFPEREVEPSETAEDVETRKRDQCCEEGSAEDFQGHGPELGASGKQAEEEPEDEKGSARDQREVFQDGTPAPFLPFEEESSRTFEKRVDDGGESSLAGNCFVTQAVRLFRQRRRCRRCGSFIGFIFAHRISGLG